MPVKEPSYCIVDVDKKYTTRLKSNVLQRLILVQIQRQWQVNLSLLDISSSPRNNRDSGESTHCAFLFGVLHLTFLLQNMERLRILFPMLCSYSS